MQLIKTTSKPKKLSQIHFDLSQQATALLKQNLALQENESVLIVTVPEMLELEAAIWCQAAQHHGSKVELLCLSGMTHSGEEPPAVVIKAATQADITILQTTYSLTHTQAGKQAIANGGRALSLPGADIRLLQLAFGTDYKELTTLGTSLEQILVNGKTIHITSPQGTDLTAGIRQTEIIAETGTLYPGELGNLPSGEVFFAPLLGTTNGTLVVDGSIADDVLDEPIIIEIRDGIATKFSGGVAAQNVEKKLAHYGKKGLTIAEIGIGTNKLAKVGNNLLEAEKAFGTVHVAFGNSSAIGGENNVPIHIDGLVSEPTVWVDGVKVLARKRFRDL